MSKGKTVESSICFHEQRGITRFVFLEELEKILGFTALQHLSFASADLEESLRERGLEKLKNQLVSQDHLRNGELWAEHLEFSDGLPSASVSIRFVSDKVGYGLFAEEDLPPNFFLIEYIGIVRKNNDHLFISDYLYSYPLSDEIGRPFVIDAHQGNLARFINHSAQPNLKVSYGFSQGIYHVGLTTSAPISKGMQLTYAYGSTYWYTREPPELL